MTDGDWNGPEQTYHDTERNLRARIRVLEVENEALKAVRDDDGELLTIAWLDGSHRSTKAHRERIRELEAENERLRNAMVVMDNTVRELTEALREMFEAVCGETGFAQAVRADSGIPYPWPALDRAEAMTRAALEIKP